MRTARSAAPATISRRRIRTAAPATTGPAGFNIPHRFVTSILYTLPFGKGQRFLNRGGVVNQVVGGWQVSTITDRAERHVDRDQLLGFGRAGDRSRTATGCNCVAGSVPVADNPTAGPLLRSGGVHQHDWPASSAIAAATT